MSKVHPCKVQQPWSTGERLSPIPQPSFPAPTFNEYLSLQYFLDLTTLRRRFPSVTFQSHFSHISVPWFNTIIASSLPSSSFKRQHVLGRKLIIINFDSHLALPYLPFLPSTSYLLPSTSYLLPSTLPDLLFWWCAITLDSLPCLYK